MVRTGVGIVSVLCLLFLLPGSPGAAVFYVDSAATGENNGTSWTDAFTTIQGGVDASYSAGGGEVWVKAGTYAGGTSEPLSDSFEARNPDSVDVVGEEKGLRYQSSGATTAADLTILYLDGDVTVAPPTVTFGNTTNQDSFAVRLAGLVDSREDVLVFANHPSLRASWGGWISQEDLAAAANANALHAMELCNSEDVAKWDYVLANLDDQAGDCSKIVWGIRSDDLHWAASIGYAHSGVMMAALPTASEDPVYSDRRTALRDMVLRGSMVALPPNSKCSIPAYTFDGAEGTATGFDIELFVDNIGGAASAEMQFYGCDWGSGSTPGTLLYHAPVTLNAANAVSYSVTQTGAPDGTPLTSEQKANIKYIRPVLAFTLSWGAIRPVYFQPVRIRGNGDWWDGPAYTLAGSQASIGPSPYPTGGGDTGETIYFNSHAHTLTSDGDAAPQTMRRKYWDNYGQLDPDKPRFGIITDHETRTPFVPPTRSVVVLKEGVRLYGGFAGIEASREQRDWMLNMTTIDAGQAGRCIYSCGSDWGDRANAVLDGFVITNAKVGGYGAGGGIWNYESSPSVSNCVFTSNEAGIGGGMCNSSASPAVTDCVFDGNSAGISPYWHPGGGMLNECESSPVIVNCMFHGNSARKGGGMCNMSSSPSVTACTFSCNCVNGDYIGLGGGMYNYSSEPVLSRCVFNNNTATCNGMYGYGGAVYNKWSDVTVAACTFAGNHADGSAGRGGAICDDGSSSVAMTNCIFAGNSAVGDSGAGGAIYEEGDPAAIIANNTIVGNSAVHGGGIHCASATSPMIANNIVAFNSSGIHNDSDGAPALLNNCVYANTEYNYSGLSAGTGDISVDPLFVGLSDGNYHLWTWSPCVDAAANTEAPSTDKDGFIRPQDGDGDGTSICDMGAYECTLNLGGARRGYPDGSTVALGGVSVTAAFPSDGAIYVERLDRTCGIRVDTPESFNEGEIVNVSGTIETDAATGERYIEATPPWPESTFGSFTLRPLVLTNRDLGGGSAGLQAGVWSWQSARDQNGELVHLWLESEGLNNIGLLVRTWGRVTHSDTHYFYLDDGSKLDDGSGHLGVKVVATGLSVPAQNSYVQVTGASSCFKVGDDLYRLIRVREQADIVVPQ